MSLAGRLEVTVISLDKGPEYSGVFQMDTTDPYVKLILHDGKFNAGGAHIGEKVQTSVKDDAGSAAKFEETFKLAKPEVMDNLRVELWDSNVAVDDFLGCIDVDLDAVFPKGTYKFNSFVPWTAQLVKNGSHVAEVKLQLMFSP